jgi:hypothetical protein
MLKVFNVLFVVEWNRNDNLYLANITPESTKWYKLTTSFRSYDMMCCHPGVGYLSIEVIHPK